MINTATYGELPAGIKYTYLHPNGQSSLVMTSAQESLLRLDRFVMSLKKLWSINETSFIKINAALNELVSNAIEHGNHSRPDKTVYVQAVRCGNQFAFMVRDQGSGFDHQHLPDPFDSPAADNSSGRGILIAQNLADEMYYGRKGNCVWTLFKQSL